MENGLKLRLQRLFLQVEALTFRPFMPTGFSTDCRLDLLRGATLSMECTAMFLIKIHDLSCFGPKTRNLYYSIW